MLENLETWLTEFNANRNGAIDAPVLVIDDEADSAFLSIRGHQPTIPTSINRRIRSLLRACSRIPAMSDSTATPFANVFIDPETEDEMLGSDLFHERFHL